MKRFTDNPRIYICGDKFHADKIMNFSGGEVHVNLGKHFPGEAYDVLIKQRVQTSDDLMLLISLCEAIIAQYKVKPAVMIPYFPYARQDRRCAKGDAFGMKIVTKMLKDYISRLYVMDLHSEAGKDIIRQDISLSEISITEIFKRSDFFDIVKNNEELVLCAPDSGATDKVCDLARRLLGHDKIIVGKKIRDPETGELTGFDYTYSEDLAGKEILIVDDICDGGGTFLGLAKELQYGEPDSISLYVTHGIFSKGYDIFNGVIDKIITTNSFIPETHSDERLNWSKDGKLQILNNFF